MSLILVLEENETIEIHLNTMSLALGSHISGVTHIINKFPKRTIVHIETVLLRYWHLKQAVAHTNSANPLQYQPYPNIDNLYIL